MQPSLSNAVLGLLAQSLFSELGLGELGDCAHFLSRFTCMQGMAWCGIDLGVVVQISKLSSNSTAAAARPTMTSLAKRQSGAASVFDPSDPHPWAASMVAAVEQERHHLAKKPIALPPDHIRHATQQSEPHGHNDSPTRFSRQSGTNPLREAMRPDNESADGVRGAQTAAVSAAAAIDGGHSGSARAAWPDTDDGGSRDSFAFGRQSDDKGVAAPTADSGDDHSCSSFSFSKTAPQPAARDSHDDSHHSFAGFPALALQVDDNSQNCEAHGPQLLPERLTGDVPLATPRSETPTFANHAGLAAPKQARGDSSSIKPTKSGQDAAGEDKCSSHVDCNFSLIALATEYIRNP